MVAVGHFLKLRLFLEGVEVPVVSANIQSAKNAAAQAAIQIPANDYALDLRPRTLVHLFAYDIYNGVPPEETVTVGTPGTRIASRSDGVDPEIAGLYDQDRFASTPDQDKTDLINENFKLIFGGEVVGFSFSKDPASRSITLQCLDWSSYWDIAYQYQVSGYSLGGGGIRAAFSGAATSVFNDFLEGSGDIVTKLISSPPRSNPNLRNTLLGGVVHLLEAIGGVYFGTKCIRGTNDFFSLAEIKLHITQMVGADPYSNRDERHLLSANGFGSLFSRSLAGLGRQVSIRAVLIALQKYIFHEIIPITAPRFIPALYDSNLPNLETVSVSQDPATRPSYNTAVRVREHANRLLKAQYRSVDEASSAREGHNVSRDFLTLSTTCARAVREARRNAVSSGSRTHPDRMVNTAAITKGFSVAASKLNEAGFITRAQRGGGDNLLTPMVFSLAETESHAVRRPSRQTSYPIIGTPYADQVIQCLNTTLSMMQDIIDMTIRRRVLRTSQQPDPPPRLLTQIYRPDAWMVSPPRCNVIFPELYSQFSFSRDYMAEITRMLLRTSDVFFESDILFDGFYMTPSQLVGVKNGRRVLVSMDPDIENANTFPMVQHDIMDHELYTGIIPTFERMSDLNLHALRGGFIEMEPGVRVGYAQLACNHIFFQKRFQSRQLQLAGKFNPYLVLGFPMLVIDKYLPVNELENGGYSDAVAARLRGVMAEGDGLNTQPDTAEQQRVLAANYSRINEIVGDILDNRANTHYLGTAEMISHSISATHGGQTSVQMGYARTTSERSEFLGDNVGDRARHHVNQRITTIVAAQQPPQVGKNGIRGGNIIGTVVDVTSEFLPRRARTATAGHPQSQDSLAAITRRRTSRTATGAVNYSSSRTAPLYIEDAVTPSRFRRGTRVVVGVEQPAQSYGPEVVALVGSGGSVDSSTINRVRGDDRRTMGEGGSMRSETLVRFNAYRITEEIGAYTRSHVELPPETLTFPPWYGDHWRSEQIGGLYAYFFGTGAITDPLVVQSGSQNSSHADTRAATPAEEARRQRTLSINFTRQVGDPTYDTTPNFGSNDRPPPGESTPTTVSGGDIPGPAQHPTPDEAAVNAEIGRIRARSPIGLATEELVRIYSEVKLNKYDVHLFVQSYTWRPIASMVDMFGTANLEINDAGTVVRGSEGFHSRAFGDFDDLRQLVGEQDGNRPRTILGLEVDNPATTSDDARAARSAPIAKRLDTRREKRTAVMQYLLRMKNSVGSLG